METWIYQARTARPRRQSSRVRRGFTLVEMLAVVCLLGVMALGATLTLRAPLGAARRQLTLERIAAWDAQMRERCRRHRTAAALEVDATTGAWWRVDGAGSVLAFEGMPLRDFRVGRRESRVGRPGVMFRADGGSDSYAIRLSGAPTDRWHLVCGGTGKWTEVNDESLAKVLAVEAGR